MEEHTIFYEQTYMKHRSFYIVLITALLSTCFFHCSSITSRDTFFIQSAGWGWAEIESSSGRGFIFSDQNFSIKVGPITCDKLPLWIGPPALPVIPTPVHLSSYNDGRVWLTVESKNDSMYLDLSKIKLIFAGKPTCPFESVLIEGDNYDPSKSMPPSILSLSNETKRIVLTFSAPFRKYEECELILETITIHGVQTIITPLTFRKINEHLYIPLETA